VRWSASAVANGLFFLSPSAAVEPARAAKAVRVLGRSGSTLARPWPIARWAMVRFMVLAKGLSPAGIEDDQAQLMRRFDCDQHPV
jgi:hypothetical protein